MAGRIRTIKPELLEDERAAELSHAAFRLFIGCMLLADDYGNLRASLGYLKAQVFWGRPAAIEEPLGELVRAGMVWRYVVAGQQYLSLRNWSKHQKVDHPGKPRVPGPEARDDSRELREDGARLSPSLAPDLDPDPDLDRNHEKDQDGDAPAIPVLPTTSTGVQPQGAAHGQQLHCPPTTPHQDAARFADATAPSKHRDGGGGPTPAIAPKAGPGWPVGANRPDGGAAREVPVGPQGHALPDGAGAEGGWDGSGRTGVGPRSEAALGTVAHGERRQVVSPSPSHTPAQASAIEGSTRTGAGSTPAGPTQTDDMRKAGNLSVGQGSPHEGLGPEPSGKKRAPLHTSDWPKRASAKPASDPSELLAPEALRILKEAAGDRLAMPRARIGTGTYEAGSATGLAPGEQERLWVAAWQDARERGYGEAELRRLGGALKDRKLWNREVPLPAGQLHRHLLDLFGQLDSLGRQKKQGTRNQPSWSGRTGPVSVEEVERQMKGEL